MIEIGYALSSEEHAPNDLVRSARMAEEHGFGYALISDHFHPWIDRQGHAPFVWSVLGGIATQTERMRVGTGVTCPTIRIHPAIIAQAAATMATMMPGRFFLGLGSGENLNEHIFGDKWPSASERIEMLAEAIQVIRVLWQGGYQEHRGRYYTVEDARIYTLPDEPPPIYVAGTGPVSASVAARLGDGFISTAPSKEVVDAYRDAGGTGPVMAQIHVCWANDEGSALRTAKEIWPNSALKGELNTELPLPKHFEQAAEMVRDDDIREKIACGPDPERHISMIKKYAEAGYDHIYIHQVGPDQEGFFRFFDREIRPQLGRSLGTAA